MSLLIQDGDIADKHYKDFTAEMYSEGHSFFTYMSSNPNALASCCRLRNEIGENEFSFTNGLTGVKTGSCNVITLNINRIVQDWAAVSGNKNTWRKGLSTYLTDILDRVYKYHISYKNLLYTVEKQGMLTASTAGYIDMQSLFSTIGVNGHNEAARFLGIEVSDNPEYEAFMNLILGTISSENTKHGSKKYKFNTELVPKRGGDVKPFLIDSKLPMGQRGASR